MKFIHFFAFLLFVNNIYSINLVNNEKVKFLKKYVVENETFDEEIKTNFFNKLKNLLLLYLQFFVIFSLISFLKWHEELYKVKTIHVESKYSNFLDLTEGRFKNRTFNELGEFDLDDRYIFISGKTDIITPAKDYILNFNTRGRLYAKIERRVDIFHKSKKKWVKLGHIDRERNEETISESLEINLPYVNFLNEHYMQVSYYGEIYTFPRIISSVFLGQAEVSSLKLNVQQLKNLKVYENFKFPSNFSSLGLFDYVESSNFNKEFNIVDYE